jgi:hypothetical protein
MGCGCGGSATKQKFVVVSADGKETEVDSRTEAIQLVRSQGGTWKAKA